MCDYRLFINLRLRLNSYPLKDIIKDYSDYTKIDILKALDTLDLNDEDEKTKFILEEEILKNV